MENQPNEIEESYVNGESECPICKCSLKGQEWLVEDINAVWMNCPDCITHLNGTINKKDEKYEGIINIRPRSNLTPEMKERLLLAVILTKRSVILDLKNQLELSEQAVHNLIKKQANYEISH